jgi:hypothetical protein
VADGERDQLAITEFTSVPTTPLATAARMRRTMSIASSAGLAFSIRSGSPGPTAG